MFVCLTFVSGVYQGKGGGVEVFELRLTNF